MDQPKERTEVICIIDRSGSMDTIRTDAIGGFNAFLAEQQAIPGDCRLTLVFFNDRLDTHCVGKPINSVAPLNNTNYVPSGQTALLDAIQASIYGTRKRLRRELTELVRARKETPLVRVVVVILTDGEENASRHASRPDVTSLITHCQREGWKFLFLAANQDAIEAGGRIGVSAQYSRGFSANPGSTRNTFNDISSFVSNSRSGISNSGNSGGNNYH